jgi:hypothetical protein
MHHSDDFYNQSVLINFSYPLISELYFYFPIYFSFIFLVLFQYFVAIIIIFRVFFLVFFRNFALALYL